MNDVVLTAHEMQMASGVGMRRNFESLASGRTHKHGYEGDGWGNNIEGACGEMALAKYLDRYWDGSVNTFKRGGDVGDLQVRTRSKHEYDLIVRSDDRDDDIFVLVTGIAPSYRVRGYIRGADAKKMDDCIRSYGNRPSAWFIPADRLKPVPNKMPK